jgi:pimeloyl-ACP methyl ester carboxylesterase
MATSELQALDAAVLPGGIRARFVDGVNGLRVHLLEAGFETPGRPCVVLLHGFPEIAYSWRRVMPALARAGYHALAPDLRGFGRTTGWDGDFDGDVHAFRMLNVVRDVVELVYAMGYRQVAGLFGHDLGARVAAWSALVRPDVFRAVALMSAPFPGPPTLRFDTAGKASSLARAAFFDIEADLAALDPPRKHYQWYYSTREANADMYRCAQGVHDFLRAYFHHKSADWPGNNPHPLRSWTAAELAKLPTYYVMERDKTMAETVAPEMPAAQQIAACRWLPDAELRVYSEEYERTGFQGGLQWYRCGTDPRLGSELGTFSGRTIEVPACFVSGASDWGIHQVPGALDAMQRRACSDFRGCHLLDGAGHWVQQEQAGAVVDLLTDFLSSLPAGG